MSDSMMDRVPPHNTEAEASVLGAIFLEPPALITASEIVIADDFYHIAHQKIFQTMLNLSDQGKAIDVVTVTEELSAKKELEDVGGLTYMTELANAVPTAIYIGLKCSEENSKKLLEIGKSIGAKVYKMTFDEHSSEYNLIPKLLQ